MPNYFLFRSSDDTHQECLDRMLVGQNSKLKNRVQKVQMGDIIFIHKTSKRTNVQSQFIEGPFFAVSEGKKDIEPDAWKGDFPWQVKIEKKSDTVRIDQESFQQFQLQYSVSLLFFNFEIDKIIGRKLMEEIGYTVNYTANKIESNETLNDIDVDFRLRYQAKYRCEDGHYARSRIEVIVDNWLYSHNIAHAYEKKIPGQKMICDFYVKKSNGKDIYIEVWGGLENPEDNKRYQNRKKDKVNIYHKLKLNLLSIEEKHFNNIDDFLGDKFLS